MTLAIATSPTANASLHSQERQDPSVSVTNSGAPSEPSNVTKRVESGSKEAQQADRVTLDSDQEVIRELKARDREVRAHEAAHAAAGGSYAGSPTYSYQQGPDGRAYAVGGEVRIDTSKIPGDPQATLEKAQTVRAAALAPAQPSSADRAIAAKATAMAAEARAELAAESEAEQPQPASPYSQAVPSANEESGSLLSRYI